jgi:hypothetical protein
MDLQRIGEVAGVIWGRLRRAERAGLPLLEIKKIPGFSQDEIVAGIGWLAREGKLGVKTDNKRIAFSLVEEEIFATSQ